jgi:hypothetical protein
MAAKLRAITEEVIRHRFDEATSLVSAAESVLREVRATAGDVNGMATAADARAAELNALATKLSEHMKDFFPRPDVDGITTRVSHEHTEAVAAAKAAQKEDGE